LQPLDQLEAARGGPFHYCHNGIVHTAPDPREMLVGHVLMVLQSCLPDTPPMPLYKLSALSERWAAHYDLPDGAQAQRLAYVVNRYRDDLEYDLRVHAHMDLGEQWRARRWRTLLATIDRLPQHTLYSEAVSQDPEHAKLLAKALAERDGEDGPSDKNPPLRTWTPEVRLLTDIFDAIRQLQHTIVAVQVPKGKAGNPPEPSPRPKTILAEETRKAEYQRRLGVHKSLVARLLPHKSQ
jgi:hypothetical protein